MPCEPPGGAVGGWGGGVVGWWQAECRTGALQQGIAAAPCQTHPAVVPPDDTAQALGQSSTHPLVPPHPPTHAPPHPATITITTTVTPSLGYQPTHSPTHTGHFTAGQSLMLVNMGE